MGLRTASMERLDRHTGLGEAGNSDSLASESVSALLDLEVARRSTESQGADPDPHPSDRDRESNVGRAQDPWRAAPLGIPSERATTEPRQRTKRSPAKAKAAIVCQRATGQRPLRLRGSLDTRGSTVRRPEPSNPRGDAFAWRWTRFREARETRRLSPKRPRRLALRAAPQVDQ